MICYHLKEVQNSKVHSQGETKHMKALKIALVELQTYKPMCGSWIPRSIAEMVGIAKLTNLEVTGKFNGVSVTATPNSSPEALTDWWSKEMDRQGEEYRNSDEYKKSERDYREREERRTLMLEEALLSAPETITLKDEDAWKKYVDGNKDFPSIMHYAERWARLMEGRMSNGGTLEECADEASHLADSEGMSGSSYGYAVGVLSQCWIHGEQLRRWHNRSMQIGNEGDEANESGGVLNPAMLCIGV
jgi:hypothetical protein